MKPSLQGDPTLSTNGSKCDPVWCDRHSPFDTTNDRARAEGELLALSPEVSATVLDLCGLWGGKRDTRNWVGRVAPTKEALAKKVRTSFPYHSWSLPDPFVIYLVVLLPYFHPRGCASITSQILNLIPHILGRRTHDPRH